VELLMNGLLTAATLFAGGYCWVLARRVRGLQSLDSGLGGSIVTLTRQIELARATLDEARDASGDSRRELSQLISRADGAASSLRLLLAAVREPAPAPPTRVEPFVPPLRAEPAVPPLRAEPAAPPPAPILAAVTPAPELAHPLPEPAPVVQLHSAPEPTRTEEPEPMLAAPPRPAAPTLVEVPKPRALAPVENPLRRAKGPAPAGAAPAREDDILEALRALAGTAGG
jgi:hypothetical protein